MFIKKSMFVAITISAFVIVSFAFINGNEPVYKNLKVLRKDISKEELDSVMHFFSMSLGQRCNFCHVRNEGERTMDFASDANPHKDIAREMMRMTTKINKEYFDFREDKKIELVESVTCYTCHHGQGEPETKPKKGLEEERGRMPGDSMRREGNRQGFSGDTLRRSEFKNMPDDGMKHISQDTMKMSH